MSAQLQIDLRTQMKETGRRTGQARPLLPPGATQAFPSDNQAESQGAHSRHELQCVDCLPGNRARHETETRFVFWGAFGASVIKMPRW